MSRMAIRLRTASFAMLLGLGASNAFAQSPAEFIEQASAKGMADIETSRMAHAKTSSQEIKDYTIEVINERTLANSTWRPSPRSSTCRWRRARRSSTKPKP